MAHDVRALKSDPTPHPSAPLAQEHASNSKLGTTMMLIYCRKRAGANPRRETWMMLRTLARQRSASPWKTFSLAGTNCTKSIQQVRGWGLDSGLGFGFGFGFGFGKPESHIVVMPPPQ